MTLVIVDSVPQPTVYRQLSVSKSADECLSRLGQKKPISFGIELMRAQPKFELLSTTRVSPRDVDCGALACKCNRRMKCEPIMKWRSRDCGDVEGNNQVVR